MAPEPLPGRAWRASFVSLPRWSFASALERFARPLALVLGAGLFVPTPAGALRIVDYNITNYPSVNGAGRDPYFRTIFGPLGADLVVVQEMQSQAGVDQFRSSVLETLEPGQWASAPFTNGNDTDNAMFYKPAKVQFLGSWAFYPNPANHLRFVNCYRVKPVGYSSEATELRFYSHHLKASQGSANEAQRLAEATGIRDSMNAVPPGTHCILLGDFNIYAGAELAMQKLIESQVDNDGRVRDPLDMVGAWHDNASFAPIHTQCPCLTCPVGSGFSGGGMDDRFDMILTTYNLGDGAGLDLLPATYVPVGQDGRHFNLNITDPPTIPEGATYANALWNASDHLPLRADLQLPARIAVPASLALGTVIAAGSADLSISNPAYPPADALTYSFLAPAGFTAPAGTFNQSAGAQAALHAIGTAAGPPGARSGDLTISTDDPDDPSKLVSLSATVLDHASAALDSTSGVASELLDFGTQPPSGFGTVLARVHNRGYNPLQARLSLSGASLTGGDGRFSIVGGFSPTLVADTARSFAIQFSDSGATSDSTYEATLTFSSDDEPLPGALPQPDLLVTLRAQVHSAPLSVGGRAGPLTTRLYPPFPNPLAGSSIMSFDLARATWARLEIFDLSGRRVAVLNNRFLEPGRHALSWNGRRLDGRAAAPGLYLVRLSGPGLESQSARLMVVR